MICRIVTACKLVINKQLKLQNSFKIRMSEMKRVCLLGLSVWGKKKTSHIDLKSWLLDLAALSFIDLNTDTRRINSSSLLKMLLIYINACIFCVCLHHCWEKETSRESSWIFSAFICLRNSHSYPRLSTSPSSATPDRPALWGSCPHLWQLSEISETPNFLTFFSNPSHLSHISGLFLTIQTGTNNTLYFFTASSNFWIYHNVHILWFLDNFLKENEYSRRDLNVCFTESFDLCDSHNFLQTSDSFLRNINSSV